MSQSGSPKLSRAQRFVEENQSNIIATRLRPRTQDDQPTSQPKSTRMEQCSNPLSTPSANELQHNNPMYIYFDGAFRSRDSSSAIGIFHGSYAHRLSRGVITNTSSSTQSEITACLQALHDVKQYPLASPIIIRGDSSHVIATISSGRIMRFHSRDKNQNSSLWQNVQATWLELLTMGYCVTMEWVPRFKNKEADELANAVLDRRSPDTNITSQTGSAQDWDTLLQAAVSRLQLTRLRTVRNIPTGLQQHWKSFIHMIAATPGWSEANRVALLTIAPHLASCIGTKISNREDFKLFRTHLTLLHDEEYLRNALQSIATPATPHPAQTSQPNPGQPAFPTSLIRRRAYAQVLRDSFKPHTVPDLQTINALFPVSPLPEPLHIPESAPPTQITHHEILNACLRSAKDKSPSLSGWSRELLLPLLLGEGEAIRALFCRIMTLISNNALPHALRKILTAIPSLFIPNGDKLRPIGLRDYFTKLAFRIVMDRTASRDTNLQQTTSCFLKPGGAGILPIVVQAALDQNETVVAVDSTNAFNCVSRHPAFAYFKSHVAIYQELFPLLNMLYTNPTQLLIFDQSGTRVLTHEQTSGTVQGCSSATWFFTCAIMNNVLVPNKGHTISFIDDIYIIRNAHQHFPVVQAQLASCNLTVNPTKTRALSPKPLHDSLAHLKHVTTVAKVAGAHVLVSRTCSSEAINTATAHISANHTSVMQRIITLNVPLQFKLALQQYTHWKYLYTATHSTSEAIRNTLSSIDEQSLATFSSLTRIPSINLQVRFFNPTEDGGLGILPLSALQQQLHAHALIHAAPLLRKLNLPLGPIPSALPIKALWAVHSVNTGMKIPRLNSSLFAAPPRFHNLDDEEFIFGVGLLIGYMNPIKYKCKHDTTTDLNNKQPAEVFEHITSCSSCGAPAYHARHREVLSSFHSACKRHHISAEVNPKDLPRVDNSKGGPDIMVWSGRNWYTGDVVIGKNLNASYTRKMRLYSKFAVITKSETFPIALDITGRFHKSTWNTILNLAKSTHGFVSNLNEQVQMSLIRGQHQGYRRLIIRGEFDQMATDVDDLPPASHDSSDVEDPDPDDT